MLIELNNKEKIFNLVELEKLLPVVVKITRSYKVAAESKMQYLEQIAQLGKDINSEMEQEIDNLIDEWKSKVIKLGAKPLALWTLGFDSGFGYYSWKYPEETVLYHQGYLDTVSARKLLSESALPLL